MRAFWNDCGEGPASNSPVEMNVEQAQRQWSDGRGAHGNFLGLIDPHDNTVQFYFTEGIPDHVEDARHLKIILVDFPVTEERGSYSKMVTIGEVHALIAEVFQVSASHHAFSSLSFQSWYERPGT